eukprot:CAMPEP_0179246616 /NCGR_PEP_ID=MMETSP0797-20121207/19185_1 /TAXON_ID=47934 /ORGANISM="Dinophysis acuminata, Strain DAEP01" /LENGTH=93 /DNA_ID=CAMNT_0020954209 /DNA_START=28 /DNA_END=306 /DNA_ORIENTATION=+
MKGTSGCAPPLTSGEALVASLTSTHALSGVLLGGGPDGEAERDLVDEVCEVVDQVERLVVDAAQQVSEEVAKGVDGPANRDDEAHRAEGGLHV